MDGLSEPVTGGMGRVSSILVFLKERIRLRDQIARKSSKQLLG